LEGAIPQGLPSPNRSLSALKKPEIEHMSTKGLRRSIESVIQGMAKHILFGAAVSGALVLPSNTLVTKADVEPIFDGHAESTTQSALISVPNLTIVNSSPAVPAVKKVATAVTAAVARPLKVADRMTLHITAYTSSPEETDDTPFITASGSRTRDGVVATNILPFGTRVQIPSLFGDKIFTVEDRMHPRFQNRMDVWTETKAEAYRIGIRTAEVVVLN
jgi:3D (Asp-Asp-Asp) domain-containing protein